MKDSEHLQWIHDRLVNLYDENPNYDYMVRFREIIKQNRKLLKDAGFNSHTVDSWAYSDRVPSYNAACKISALLGVVLTEIPYFKKEHVI